MFCRVKVIANAGRDEVIVRSKGEYTVKTAASPERGKANKRVLQLLADHFQVRPADVLIVKGRYSSRKIINVNKKL